jgi:hypothetical protein
MNVTDLTVFQTGKTSHHSWLLLQFSASHFRNVDLAPALPLRAKVF